MLEKAITNMIKTNENFAESFRKETEDVKKNQMEISELKNTITKT